MRHRLRVFEVQPDAPAAQPVALDDCHVEADTVDASLREATKLFGGLRRQIRSLSLHVDGGLLAYVYPQAPEMAPKPAQRKRRGRR